MKRISRWQWATMAVILIAVAAFIGWQAVHSTPTKPQSPPVRSFSSGAISFSYTSDYTQGAVVAPARNQKSTYLVRLRANSPDRTIDLAQERGAIIGANVTRTNFLDFLESNSNRMLPIAYRGYKKGATRRIEISGREALSLTFTYNGRGNTRLYVRLIVIPYQNDGYYLTMQSADGAAFAREADRVQRSLRLR